MNGGLHGAADITEQARGNRHSQLVEGIKIAMISAVTSPMMTMQSGIFTFSNIAYTAFGVTVTVPSLRTISKSSMARMRSDAALQRLFAL